MKKINLLIAAGLLASASMQAQVTTIASVGFESGDQKYTTEYAYTPGGTYGNWVNRQENDVWDEQSQDDVNSGEYAFVMQNDAEVEGAGQTWLRGFTIGGLKLTENTPYRVSFWVKGEPGMNLKSSMNIGYEYCDMNIRTKGGLNYYYCTETGKGIKLPELTGEWQKISYVTFFTNKADQDAYADEFADKEDPNGNVPMPKGSVFPEEYNVIINCYNGGNYILDDIKVEAGVAFNEARVGTSGMEEYVRLDFGYPTNIATLAGEGVLSLDPSCATVTVDGVPATVTYIEGHADGYLYVFFARESDDDLTADNKVVVSFTPAADCPIVYNTGMRPSADTDADMPVVAVANEEALFDESIDDIQSSAFQPAVMVSSTPENESFELVASELKLVSVTFDKVMDITTTSASVTQNGKLTDLSDNMELSEDGKTITTYLPVLADGEYDFVLAGLATDMGTECENVTISFAVGEDHDETISETIFKTDFDNELTGGIPVGWRTWNSDHGFHLYGFNDEARTSQYVYSWGGTPGGGGCKLEAGFSGLFTKAMYWGSRGNTDAYAYADFGAQVNDWILENGEIDPEMPEGISLYLEPGKYNIKFLMAAWKNAPKFTFTLTDLANSETYAKFENQTASPTLCDANGNKYNNGNVTEAKKCQADFTVATAGYYVLRFTAAELAQWQEFCLANVELITMPSKAAYNKQRLAAAVELYKPVLEDEAYGEEYDGETKTALENAINYAETHQFHSAGEVDEAIANMKAAAEAMQARIKNLDNFNQSVEEAQLAYYGEENPNYDPEDETSEQWLTKPIAGTKYENSDIAKEAKALIDAYAEVSPSTLSDETLAEVSPKLVAAASALKGLHSSVDVLTWRAYKAGLVADVLGVTGAARDKMGELVTDDTEAIEELNGLTKLALYEMLAADPVIPEEKKTTVNYSADQQSVVDGEYVQMTGEEVATSGIDFACLVRNPKFYTYATDFGASISDNTVVGWNCEQYEGGSLHLNGAAATAENPVVNCSINAYYGGAEYNFYQVIENAPVGIYDVYIQTRTATKNNVNPDTGVKGVFNAMDDDSGIWDKYIYAQVDDNDPIMVPFSAGSNWGGYPTVVKNVAVGEGQKLTIGVIEHYVSGKASGHDWIDATEEEAGHYKPTDRWDTNTTATDARLYFVAPLENYDYGQAATGIETVEAIKAAKGGATFNVAGQRVDASYKGIVIKADGTKKYQK